MIHTFEPQDPPEVLDFLTSSGYKTILMDFVVADFNEERTPIQPVRNVLGILSLTLPNSSSYIVFHAMVRFKYLFPNDQEEFK